MSGYDVILEEFGRWREAYLVLPVDSETQRLMKKGYLEIIERAIKVVELTKESGI